MLKQIKNFLANFLILLPIKAAGIESTEIVEVDPTEIGRAFIMENKLPKIIEASNLKPEKTLTNKQIEGFELSGNPFVYRCFKEGVKTLLSLKETDYLSEIILKIWKQNVSNIEKKVGLTLCASAEYLNLNLTIENGDSHEIKIYKTEFPFLQILLPSSLAKGLHQDSDCKEDQGIGGILYQGQRFCFLYKEPIEAEIEICKDHEQNQIKTELGESFDGIISDDKKTCIAVLKFDGSDIVPNQITSETKLTLAKVDLNVIEVKEELRRIISIGLQNPSLIEEFLPRIIEYGIKKLLRENKIPLIFSNMKGDHIYKNLKEGRNLDIHAQNKKIVYEDLEKTGCKLWFNNLTEEKAKKFCLYLPNLQNLTLPELLEYITCIDNEIKNDYFKHLFSFIALIKNKDRYEQVMTSPKHALDYKSYIMEALIYTLPCLQQMWPFEIRYTEFPKVKEMLNKAAFLYYFVENLKEEQNIFPQRQEFIDFLNIIPIEEQHIIQQHIFLDETLKKAIDQLLLHIRVKDPYIFDPNIDSLLVDEMNKRPNKRSSGEVLGVKIGFIYNSSLEIDCNKNIDLMRCIVTKREKGDLGGIAGFGEAQFTGCIAAFRDVRNSMAYSLESIFNKRQQYEIPEEFFVNNNLLLMVGKHEGYSSDTAIFICILSAIKGIPVRGDTVISGGLSKEFGYTTNILGKYRVGVMIKIMSAYLSGYGRAIFSESEREEIETLKKQVNGKNYLFGEFHEKFGEFHQKQSKAILIEAFNNLNIILAKDLDELIENAFPEGVFQNKTFQIPKKISEFSLNSMD